jgi:hypothetical protein
MEFFQASSYLSDELARARDEADNYRRSYENAMGDAGQVRDELKKCEIRVRDLQNEV